MININNDFSKFIGQLLDCRLAPLEAEASCIAPQRIKFLSINISKSLGEHGWNTIQFDDEPSQFNQDAN
jgi:hypothetical protein